MFQYFRILRTSWNRKPPVKMLGRWNREDNIYLKVDYANLDSCGGRLSGLPTQFDLKIGSQSYSKQKTVSYQKKIIKFIE